MISHPQLGDPPVRPSASFRPFRGLTPAASLALLLACGSALAQSADPVNPPPPAGTDTPASTAPSPFRVRKVSKSEEEKQKAQQKKQNKKEPKLSKEERRRLDFESGGRTAVEWYKQAVQLYKSGHYLDARSILLPLEDSARALDIQEQVKLLIADTYFAQGGALNLAEALARYKSFETFFPSSEHAEYVQFQIGRSFFKQIGPKNRDQSFTDNVIFEYNRFLELYPHSQYADQARQELMQAKVLRARHELSVAEFYWTWNDYRAAATRLETLLAEWPELPEREKALWMAAQSLYNFGARQEGDAYAARLASDYPGSPYLAKLDAGALGGRTIEAQLKRQHAEEKESSRTHRRQLAQDMKRTKQIRKDSGLPANVPLNAPPMEIAPAAAAAPDGAPPAAAPAMSDKDAEQIRRDKERAAKLEAEEQAQIAKAAEADRKRQEKEKQAAAEAEAKAAKEAERKAKQTPEQAAKEAEDAAKAAEQRQKEVDRLEAEEAAKTSEKSAQQQKKAAKEAEAAAKKAAKKAKKKS